MINLSLRTVGKYALKFCGLALYGLLATKSVNVKVNVNDGQSATAPGYGDAINAIVESDMWDGYKDEAASALKRNECAEYYKSVIRIVTGDMWDGYKVDMIERLSKK